jgi:ABC-type antimicrobial peptide transport system permease subunit
MELEPIVYLPERHMPAHEAWFMVRTGMGLSELAPVLRQRLAEVDGNLALTGLTTQHDLARALVAEERLFGCLSGAFALLAVLISSVGIHGLIAYRVTRRTGEIGLRIALGAQRGQVLREILGESLWLTMAGVGLGIPLAVAALRIVRHLLYGVELYDLPTLTGAVLVFVPVAVLAAWLPARRASRTDPMIALRSE